MILPQAETYFLTSLSFSVFFLVREFSFVGHNIILYNSHLNSTCVESLFSLLCRRLAEYDQVAR